ncbi:MAG: coproporphyrinogen III oxidase family protein [Clostridiales bacterium]|nr:coproporphyrinogen III oxidase family protein [Clostridiales bacterium]
MNTGKLPIGLYIHIPFCAGKCPYCDFYSFAADDEAMDQYCSAVVTALDSWAAKLHRPIDTLYFGGGTPSFIGAQRLAKLVGAAVSAFKTKNIGGGKPPPYSGIKARKFLTRRQTPSCQPVGRGLAPAEDNSSSLEITVECNPSNVGGPDSCFDFEKLAQSGVNRLSLGLQSAVDSERRSLGRKGSAVDVTRAIQRAKSAGITNISLDLMLGIPGQTMESLQQSIDFCANAGITHVSAYMLKIEDGTPFATQKELLVLPNEDETCAFYLKTCEELEKAGFMQYEISNFAQNGFESRHNLKYWNCEEYLGIGPSAHSFINGKRFYYEQDLQAFLNAREPVQDGIGGDFEEYAMLRLRLNEGLTQRETLERYGFDIPIMMWERARPFAKEQLLTVDVKGIRFTPEGFLLSNVIIGELLTNMG